MKTVYCMTSEARGMFGTITKEQAVEEMLVKLREDHKRGKFIIERTDTIIPETSFNKAYRIKVNIKRWWNFWK